MVEDEVKTAHDLRQSLGEAGFGADLARNGLNCHRLARAGDFDLIVLDMTPPAVDG